MVVTRRIEELKQAMLDCKRPEIEAAVNGCLEDGMSPEDVMLAIQDIMCDVGQMFEKGRIFLPQMLSIAMSIENVPQIIKTAVPKADLPETSDIGVVMGTVQGDVHDIGKNICTILFTTCGYKVNDLGRDVPVDRFVEAVKEGATFCGMSSLMTTTMLVMKDVIDALESNGLRKDVYVMVGGSPVPQSFADKIGADIYGETAFETLARMNETKAKADRE